MPNPFPGMDPFLERPSIWSIFHGWLIYRLANRLTAVLPKDYLVSPGERLYVVQEARPIFPDVIVVESPPRTPHLHPEEIREPYIEIVRAADPGRVVTTIEVLSPRNKSRGNSG